ncbi:unnamed protein product, partial [Iphiclides podalirius]
MENIKMLALSGLVELTLDARCGDKWDGLWVLTSFSGTVNQTGSWPPTLKGDTALYSWLFLARLQIGERSDLSGLHPSSDVASLRMGDPNIIGETKAARLHWLGHLERRGEERAIKRARMWMLDGKFLPFQPKPDERWIHIFFGR